MRLFASAVLSYIRRTDILIWLVCFVLSCLSLLLLFGIIRTGHAYLLGISMRNIFVQALSVVIGTCGAIVISLIDYKDLARLWKLHVPVCYILLILTFFIGVGAAYRPDDRRWLVVPGVGLSLQPAELLRVSFILAYAYHIYKVQQKQRINHPLHLAGLLAHGAIPVVLIHLQGDAGSALVFATIVVCMLFAAGLSWKYIVSATVLAGISLPLMWTVVLNDFHRQRIMAMFDVAARDIQGNFFQQHWALTALALGGRGGRGFFGADHVYVPEMHNDFIFAFLGESAGFVGAMLAIMVMGILWLAILRCAGKAKDMLGYMICIGVFAMLAFQAMINIGMNIGVLPVIGNTLPFISYGGSSMLTSYLGVGLVLSVGMHSSKAMFGEEE